MVTSPLSRCGSHVGQLRRSNTSVVTSAGAAGQACRSYHDTFLFSCVQSTSSTILLGVCLVNLTPKNYS